jgi:molybdopterin-guanine dinucleotide biosynthesis protein B
MDIVAVIGAGQNSGKTTAVETLVSEFKRRGLKVGTIKQIHEQNFSIDKKGKDTWRHAQAGAEIVVAASPNQVVAIKKITGKNRFEEALKILKGQELDLLVVEGHPGLKVPMIYSARDENPEEAKPIDENVLCIVSLSTENFKKPQIPLYHTKDETRKVADLILKALKKGRGNL